MNIPSHGAGVIYAGLNYGRLGQNFTRSTNHPLSPWDHVIIKPPVRFQDTFRPVSNQHGVIKTDYCDYEKNDKVVVILQNILRKLENDIEHDRKRLKEERRRRKKERRQQREEKREMTSRVTLTRHEFSSVPSRPFNDREEGSSSDRKLHVFKQDTGKIRKHDSFTFADMFPKSCVKQSPRSYLEIRTRSLDRRSVHRSDSYGVSDWSRHSRDSDAADNAENDKIEYDCNSVNATQTKPQEKLSERQEENIASDIRDKHLWGPTDGLSRVRTEGLEKSSSDSSVSKSFDGQYTPTNIRRKLKSFEILPNLKKNGKTKKAVDISTGTLKGNGSGAGYSQTMPDTAADVYLGTNQSMDCSSDGDDDDEDIVFPGTRELYSTSGREVKFSIGSETEESNGYATNSQGKHKPTGDTAGTLVTDRRVAMFRKKKKCSGAGLVGTSKGDTERPTSAGTSGYSTDECSNKATDSEDDGLHGEKENDRIHDSIHSQRLKRYFLVLQNGINMALKVDNPALQNDDHDGESCLPFLQNISMSDLAIPDHMGWLIDQSEQCNVWGVVVDMLFCVFEDESSAKPRDVIILPGCNIRPLVYNTAINGVNSGRNSQTITGISKYQIVIDDSSSGRKHVYGLENQLDLDTWHKVLKKASTLDPELTTDMSSTFESEKPTSLPRPASFDGVLSSGGYVPSLDSTRRSQRMRGTRDNEDKVCSPNDSSALTNGHDGYTNGGQSSPRSTSGLVRNDSRRQSISDFKKRLRQETKPEVSKQLPVKATHFQQPTSNEQPQNGQNNNKKLRSFGSFESLLKFKRKKSKSSEDSISNDDVGSIVSTGSVMSTGSGVSGSSSEQNHVTRSVDISASVSQLQKKRGKKLSRSLELKEPKNGVSNGIVRRASDIKDKVFSRRPSKPFAKLGDLHDVSQYGFLLHKHHLKWQKLWCVVCRGCFYGFKSNSPDENALIAVLLANCAVVFVSQQDKKQKRLYVFKLSQERSKSIYLCADNYRDLMKWLTVLQMESNSVISNADKIRKSSESENDSICSSLSSQSGSILTVSSIEQTAGNEPSRSRSKKKKAPAKPPRKFRNSSCPPAVARESGSSTGEETLTSGSISSSTSSTSCMYGSSEDLPRYDKAVTHVWQNDRGYLFNAIRAKLSSYRKKEETIYNKDLPGADNEGLMVVQDGAARKGSRDVRRSRSFNAHSTSMADDEQRLATTPSESDTYGRKRHKPLVVKKIPASDLEERQAIAGYIEKKSVSSQWIRYWYVLHDGTLFCYLTSDDSVTVDVLNLHGYSVTSLVDKFRGKRFVLQLSHEYFTSVHLSTESREDMESWLECLQQAIQQPSSVAIETDAKDACDGCEQNRQDEVGEKRKQVKQKLLEEMLRQKHELERKQAERQKKQRGREFDSPERYSHSLHPPDFLADEQRTSDVTWLRQRRMSTQLKVETIQKQIEKPSGTKRGLFGFGKVKKLDENKNVFLQDQLKELTGKLQKIDVDLNQVECEKKLSESYDVNQNRRSMPASRNSVERGFDSDDIKQTTSIRNAMHKWTNKTFSKGSVKRSQSSQGDLNCNDEFSKGKHNSEPELHEKENGISNSTGFHTGHFGHHDNSVTDLTRPLADLKLDLSLPLTQTTNQSGSASPSSVGYNRSNSRTSTMSSLSSPRREIDPSVLAEIDAFEELTRQVLGARSKDTATKVSASEA